VVVGAAVVVGASVVVGAAVVAGTDGGRGATDRVVICWSAASAGPPTEHDATTGAATARSASEATTRNRAVDANEGGREVEEATMGVDAEGGDAQTTAAPESPGGRLGVRPRAIRTTP
jgi:hypothetical protein